MKTEAHHKQLKTVKTANLLHELLVEYSKIDFTKHCNLDTELTDLANIHIELEGAELFATCIIKKTSKYDKTPKEMDFSELLSTKPKIRISRVEVLESTVLVNNDALEISSFRLSAAHDEQLHLKV